MDTLFGPYFHFCFELALETWAKAALTQSFWVHDPNHTHYKSRNGAPTKGGVPETVCANKVRNGPASADQSFSTASQGFPMLKPTHLPLSHLFC